MKREILPRLEESVDYKAAFSSIGKFFSGEAGFKEAVDNMVAFLITGEDAIQAGSSEVDGNNETRSSAGVHSDLAVSKLDEYYNTAQKSQAESRPWSIANGPEERISDPEPTMTKDEEAVAAFIASQSAFPNEAIPTDVNVEKVSLPFDFIAPVDGVISSSFGYRIHPIDLVVKFHYGTDFDGTEGTQIHAFASGKVLVSGDSETLGKYLIVSHDNGFVTQYFHCSKLLAQGGDQVTMGETIAEIGKTGNATGPHLHFELLQDGLYLNPEYYLSEQTQ